MAGRAVVGLAALGGALALAACGGGRRGSGVQATQERHLPPFSAVEIRGAADVSARAGAAQAVTVRADSNLIGHVLTEVEGSTLVISEDEALSPRVPIRVDVAVPRLTGVAVTGAGNVTARGVRGPAFRVRIGGAGAIRAAGEVGAVRVDVSGAGDVRLADLTARTVSADVSGAGTAEVRATDALRASVSGAGTVTYAGSPRRVIRRVSGAGRIVAR